MAGRCGEILGERHDLAQGGLVLALQCHDAFVVVESRRMLGHRLSELGAAQVSLRVGIIVLDRLRVVCVRLVVLARVAQALPRATAAAGARAGGGSEGAARE